MKKQRSSSPVLIFAILALIAAAAFFCGTPCVFQASDRARMAEAIGNTKQVNPSRPLLFDSPPTASGLEFDPELWERKVIVLRIDSSTKPERLNPVNRLLDGDNNELLTPASEVWGASTTKVEIAYPLRPDKR